MDGEYLEEKGKRRIKLFCPSVSKLIQILVVDEQRLDLGSIAREFGLNPATLKLNGHFISRGVDLIASSVKWKSLIGFFSSRGLSTGASDSDALIVDGKLSKVGSKRSHGLEETENGILDMRREGCFRDNKRPQYQHCRLFKDEKEVISGNSDLISETAGPNHNALGLKRKGCLEDEIHKKRKKSNDGGSGGRDRKYNGLNNIILSCTFMSKTMKRMRSKCNEAIGASTIKKSKIIEPT